MSTKGIPVREFVALEKEAREAYKRADFDTIARINQRLSEIGATIFWKEGEAYLLTLNQENPLPFDDEAGQS